MTSLEERIAQYRKMATDDAENELGHYRLGQLLAENGQHEEAIKSFQRTLELSPQFSKVFHLLGASLLKMNRRAEGVKVLKDGFAVADERGDKIPAEEMAKMLKELGEELPASKRVVASTGPGDGFHCQRPGCNAGGRARQLPAPPLPDEIGQRIHKNVCVDCWQDWFKNYSIKVINELRLDLSTEKGQEVYDQVMREFLGLE